MSRNLPILSEAMAPAAPDEQTGFGALETARGRLPLTALEVEARIVGLIAQVNVRQTFRNALDEPLEATYIFPLPDRAAVTRFRMSVQDRTIDGELKERGEAREEYRAAIAQGHRAAIAEEDRSGVFQLRVGNLLPKEEATIELTLVQPLPVSDGEATFRFPLVVAPRYTPGVPLDGPSVGAGVTPDTDQVPDASRVTPLVLLPGFPHPVALSLKVELPISGMAAEDGHWADRIRSSLHSTLTDEGPPWTIRLQPGERLDRDFILRFPVAGSLISTSLVCHAATAAEPGTFALTLLPPAGTAATRPAPRKIVFVLDRSGSMTGWKMVAARRALGRMIDTLLDQDQFTALAFDSVVEYAPHAPQQLVAGTNRERWRMLEWLAKVDARGGTEMGPALEAALRLLSSDATGYQPILVLITDGQMTAEDAILRSLSRSNHGPTPKIFTVGIDQAVNAGFLQKLADFAHGQCELVESEERLDEALQRIHRLIGSPTLTQVRVEPVDCAVQEESFSPHHVPDLFSDRPVMVFGRYPSGTGSVRLRLCAVDAQGQPWQQEVVGQVVSLPMLKSMWGRARIRELEDEYAAGRAASPEELMRQIVAVSLDTHVLSRFTAYVAVDRSEVANPAGRPLEVVQPVEIPAGWAAPSPPAAVMRCSYSLASHPQTAEWGAMRSRIRSLGMFDRIPFLTKRAQEHVTLPQPPNVAQWLEAAIASQASEVQVERVKRQVHIRFVRDGKVLRTFSEPGDSWDAVLGQIRHMANLSEPADLEPQQGIITLQLQDKTEIVFHVAITLTRRGGKVVISIPQAGSLSPESPATDERKRSRFWT